MEAITTTRRPGLLSRRIVALARLIGSLPVLDGTQQKRLVELMTELRHVGVSVDALHCALEDAAEVAE